MRIAYALSLPRPHPYRGGYGLPGLLRVRGEVSICGTDLMPRKGAAGSSRRREEDDVRESERGQGPCSSAAGSASFRTEDGTGFGQQGPLDPLQIAFGHGIDGVCRHVEVLAAGVVRREPGGLRG